MFLILSFCDSIFQGDNECQSSEFLRRYLGWDPVSSLPAQVLTHTLYIGYHHRQYARVVPSDPAAEPFLVQNWEGLESHLESLETAGQSSSSGAAANVSALQSPFERLLSFTDSFTERSRSSDAAAEDTTSSHSQSQCHHVEIYLPIEALKVGK